MQWKWMLRLQEYKPFTRLQQVSHSQAGHGQVCFCCFRRRRREVQVDPWCQASSAVLVTRLMCPVCRHLHIKHIRNGTVHKNQALCLVFISMGTWSIKFPDSPKKCWMNSGMYVWVRLNVPTVVNNKINVTGLFLLSKGRIMNNFLGCVEDYTANLVSEKQPLSRRVKTLNTVSWVRERTIPIERPPLVGEVSTNFCR
jgi:hypothetical protein